MNIDALAQSILRLKAAPTARIAPAAEVRAQAAPKRGRMIETFSHLPLFRTIGNARFVACCPSHEDKSPSLSGAIHEKKLLIHCHAGCTAEQILRAIGLDWSALFEDATKRIDSDATIQQKNNVMAGFRKWREDESRIVSGELRDRDMCILAIKEAVAASTMSEATALDKLVPLYDRYSEMEWKFEVLVKGTDAQALEVYRGKR
jgi:hypothetical protein